MTDPDRVPTEEFTDAPQELISSRRVEGTKVFNREGEKLGTILMFVSQDSVLALPQLLDSE